MERLRVLLAPLALIHACVLHVRHGLFNAGLLKSRKATLPTVVVGNLSAGGTGKTPFTEWLLNNLDQDFHLAVLSRGYGRSTKGFRWVETTDSPQDVGDEPLQIKRHFPHIPVAVCADRHSGLERMNADAAIGCVLLDDAFQHRRLVPTYAILLTAWHRPWFKDQLLPWGGLRDLKKARGNAQSVVVTKCPATEHVTRTWRAPLGLSDAQSLHQAELVYKAPLPMGHSTPLESVQKAWILSGIADDGPFVQHCQNLQPNCDKLSYPDHHRYSLSDLENVRKKIGTFEDGIAGIFTTEKDWTKLQELPESSRDGLLFFVLPIAFRVSEPELLIQDIQQCIKAFHSS